MGLSPPGIPHVSRCSPSHLLGSWASSPVRLPGPMALISNRVFFFLRGFLRACVSEEIPANNSPVLWPKSVPVAVSGSMLC